MNFIDQMLKNHITGMLVKRDGKNFIKLDEYRWDNGNGQTVTAEICIPQEEINGSYGWDQHVECNLKVLISVKAGGK